jgi:hypothetical protein
MTVEKMMAEKMTVENGDSARLKPVQKVNLVSAESATSSIWEI